MFGPPPEGLDISESRVRQNDTAVVALAVLALLAVVLRLVARYLQRHQLKADDWTIVFSLLLVGVTVGLSIAGGAHGAGDHIWTVSPLGLRRIFEVGFSCLFTPEHILYVYTLVYGSACAAIKISILLFYQRIFITTATSFRISMIVGYFLSISFPIIILITMANACKPVSFYWNEFVGEKGECIDINKFYLAMGIFNMFTDIVLLLIPIPQILGLQMSARRKLAVCSILLLGSLVCVTSIVRIWYLDVFIKAQDITWMMGPVLIFSAIEPAVAIVSACLPHLAPLRHLVRDSMPPTQRRSTQSGPSNNNTMWRSDRLSSNGSKQGQGAIFTYGGSRFDFVSGGRMVKLPESDDEIGLTTRVTGEPADVKITATDSLLEKVECGNAVVIRSSFKVESERVTQNTS
ncbi:hypothetical protein LX36DRAFT_571998 [Colletotrichum falcatum]|nr:hypothetical protein LX36DRAFT_571998 [Colletotrichum falcatum]